MPPDRTNLRHRIKTSLQIGRALRLVRRTAPGWTLINLLLVTAQSALPVAALYLIKRILDTVTEGLAASEPVAAFQPVLWWVALAALVALLTTLLRSLTEYTTLGQSQQVTDKVASILHAQSIAVDLAYYEDPNYYNTLQRAQQEAPYRPTSIVNGLIDIVKNSLSLLGILGLLLSLNWALVVILFAAAIPGVVVRLVNSKRLYAFTRAQTEKERRAWYYHLLMTSNIFAKELRLFNMGSLFNTRFQDLRGQIRSGRLKIARVRAASEFFAQALTTLALFGTLAWIAHQVLLGQVTLGDLMVYYLGFQNGLSFLQGALQGLSGLYEDNLFLTDLYQFLDLQPSVTAPVRPQPLPPLLPCKIEVRNLGFTYTSRDEAALHGINLDIEPGEVVALVGENGSGKSTMVKLLCRLYDPTEGAIYVDGVDLREYDPVTWQRQFSVTFQDYAHYAMTVSQNIWLGDTESPPDDTLIAEAAHKSGAARMIERLPQGYQTMLSHWFEKGQELSEGEWQKIALARAFWHQAHFLILDEPTASLDPLAEKEIFDNFRQMLDGRSVILISHRFSTVKMADRIYVLDQGRIVEVGDHTALMRQGGLYARLYSAQAKNYQTPN